MELLEILGNKNCEIFFVIVEKIHFKIFIIIES